MKKILFVCLGNICRSPLAEGLANKIAKESGLEQKVVFDSCGTGAYHIGEQPDPRTMANAKSNGLIIKHQARQFDKSDFREFDYILAMDQDNLANIKKIDQTSAFEDKLFLMRDFDSLSPGADVPDPYFGGSEGFQNVYDILERSINEFMNKKLY